jgi:archaellum component FlaC
VLKKYVRKIAESLKGMKHDIHLISLNNILKFSFMFMNFLGKSKKDLKFETIETKINNFFKKKSWKKLKNCEKFYNYEFSEFITISNVSVSPNYSLLVSKEKNHSNTLSEQFLQLYSLINSSLKTQRLIYNKIEENCSNLSESLSMTKESLRSLDDSISEYDSKISSINANKSKVFHSNQLLEDWCNKSQVLEEDYKRLSKSIQQSMELDNSLESEVHQLTKSVAELSNACNDSELEISRIEFDYSHVVRERDSFRNSPERHTRLGLSPSPGRRSPVKARGSPLRDSFRSPVKSFVARSPISPDRSRARSRVYQE